MKKETRNKERVTQREQLDAYTEDIFKQLVKQSSFSERKMLRPMALKYLFGVSRWSPLMKLIWVFLVGGVTINRA